MKIEILRTSRVENGLWRLRFVQRKRGDIDLITTVCVHDDGDMEQIIKTGAEFATENFRYMREFNAKQTDNGQ